MLHDRYFISIANYDSKTDIQVSDILSIIFTLIDFGTPFQVKFLDRILNGGVEMPTVNRVIKTIAFNFIPDWIFEFGEDQVDACSGVEFIAQSPDQANARWSILLVVF